ncbi:MAG: 1-acyl-sn-glycerol-3-phosphate acyltransferase, partial [Cytophagales bacterium]|nr:1-acyl-sn-glycerol-3-phosphate acyltransferase [Cytophagales bacterium]
WVPCLYSVRVFAELVWFPFGPYSMDSKVGERLESFDWRHWPILRFTRARRTFKKSVTDSICEHVLSQTSQENLIAQIELTVHKEKIRIRRFSWSVDPRGDIAFWQGIERHLINMSGLPEDQKGKRARVLLRKIVSRYVREILGHFRPRYYFGVVKFYAFLDRMLHILNWRNSRKGVWDGHKKHRHFSIFGKSNQVRNLSRRGTVIFLPTHISNLDSVLVGLAAHAVGVPPLAYGAGLNLFNSKFLGHFMNRLGAYKIDRRRKNPLYLNTIQVYTKEVIKYGCHTVFFPGGTRSRSGDIEARLKLGLLGTVITAQRELLQAGSSQKIFIVPMVLNYPFVLEASSSIRDYLRQKGKEHYYTGKRVKLNFFGAIKCILRGLTGQLGMIIRLGDPMDVLGNKVNEKGDSLDERGNLVDINNYFLSSQAKITADGQRESQYTRLLERKLVSVLHAHNHVLPSHVVAFVAFELLQKKYKRANMYDIFRLDEGELFIEFKVFQESVDKVRKSLEALQKENKIFCDGRFSASLDEFLLDGIKNCGSFHARLPLKRNKKGDIVTEDMSCLFYYHNRLQGYELESYV